MLSAVVSGGRGPLLYAWHGYRDDGTAFNDTFSSLCAAEPSVALVFPGSDFYFFVEVTDCGNLPITDFGSCAAACPGGTRSGAYVRVHEADDALARFTVSPDPIHANATDVIFDASASTGVVTPVGWTLQYIGNVPRPPDIEGYLTLQSGPLAWNNVDSRITDLMVLDLPPATFANQGAYRMLLQVNGAVSTHQTYEYFYVDP